MDEVLSDTPYWWRTGGLGDEGASGTVLPRDIDVAIVGSGIGGLSAALTAAQAGLSVCVLDAGPLCGGASSRNFASAGSVTALTYASDRARLGETEARRRLAEQDDAYAAFRSMALSAFDHCGLIEEGLVWAALTQEQLAGLASVAAASRDVVPQPAEILDRTALRERIATDAYVGGLLLPNAAEFDAGRFMAHLLARAREAGAVAIGGRAVRDIQRTPQGYALTGADFRLSTRHVIVAVNGYLGMLGGGIGCFLNRRIIPLAANMIATEELPADRIVAAMPRPTCFADSRNNFYCVRLSPDRRRILFAARTGKRMTTEGRARALGADLAALFPALGRVKIAHSWSGMIAMPRDRRSHVGSYDGISFVTGCAGSGMVRHFALGRKLAERILDPAGGGSNSYETPLPPLPPLLPKRAIVRAATLYYDILDARMTRRQ